MRCDNKLIIFLCVYLKKYVVFLNLSNINSVVREIYYTDYDIVRSFDKQIDRMLFNIRGVSYIFLVPVCCVFKLFKNNFLFFLNGFLQKGICKYEIYLNLMII